LGFGDRAVFFVWILHDRSASRQTLFVLAASHGIRFMRFSVGGCCVVALFYFPATRWDGVTPFRHSRGSCIRLSILEGFVFVFVLEHQTRRAAAVRPRCLCFACVLFRECVNCSPCMFPRMFAYFRGFLPLRVNGGAAGVPGGLSQMPHRGTAFRCCLSLLTYSSHVSAATLSESKRFQCGHPCGRVRSPDAAQEAVFRFSKVLYLSMVF
jgi:hypothetical protein